MRSSFTSYIFKSYSSNRKNTRRILINYDIVIVSHLQTFSAIIDCGLNVNSIKFIGFTEVLESRIWSSLVNKNSFKGLLRGIDSSKKIILDEVSAINFSNHVFSYSQKESLDNNLCFVPFPYVNNYFVNNKRTNRIKSDKITIGFIGSMLWQPNLIALIKLLKWAKSYKISVRLLIIGKGSEKLVNSKLKELRGLDFLVCDQITEINDFYDKIDFLWGDIDITGGVRVKIVESLINGVTPIVNKNSLEGIPAKFHEFCINKEELIYKLESDSLDSIKTIKPVIIKKEFSSCNLSKIFIKVIS